ncbi:protein FAM171B-like isoform X2 [Salminus brasiliensis]|uniref:protein FAM171B-like isoform X2 n=1 Tax=Salminus brasiliensis TaxID=930266 RepID=UPI003B834A05
MFPLPVFLLFLTLSICSKDGLRGVVVDHSFVRTEDALQRERGVSARAAVLDAAFTLRIQVKDAVSHQPLSQASVNVFVNYTLISSTKTSRDGSSALSIPYSQGRALIVVASKDGYVPTALPWKTTKKPIFSQNQGNIWLFEDLVVITGKIPGAMPQPNVQFSKSLLSLPESNISSLTAYLTGPQLPAERHYIPHTTGIIISKSGYRSIELNPVAAVSVQLLCSEEDIQVTGPIQITLPLPKSSQSKPSDTIPAWSFNRKTGAWVNRGLGIVKMEDTRLVWVYIAPNLGYWIAAPFPSPPGYLGHENTLDFFSYHTYLLMAILGGTLVIAVGLFGVVSCCCRHSLCETPSNRVSSTTKAVQKKDQTTCTNNDRLDISFRDPIAHEDELYSAASQSTSQRDQSVCCEINGSFKTCVKESEHPAPRIYENIGGIAAEPAKPSHQPPLYMNSSEIVMPVSRNEKMFLAERVVLYNQPVAILQMPGQFRSSEQASGSKSATLPRKLIRYENLEKSVSKDTFTQTLPKSLLLLDNSKQVQEEAETTESPYGDPGTSSNPGGWSYFNGLLESVSVPGTLNEARGIDALCGNHQGISEQTLLELSKSKPFPHPRAWFVSLEGKPAAQVRHSIVDLRRSHLLTDSNDTSLDSGVDLNEQQQLGQQGVRSMVCRRPLCLEDGDLSSSESGTTTVCSPEEPALKNILHGSSGTISNLPQDRPHADTFTINKGSECTSSTRVHKLKKSSETGRAKKPKNTWHRREERPLMKLK